MKSISFDNPYLLLIAIPLFLLIFIPYFIAVSRDNKNKSWTISLVVHSLIAVCVSLAAAGLVHTTVMTRTKVYVVADVSYSSSRNLDKIDEYIAMIEENMPQNSRLGVVCFGKDSTILTSSGMEIKSVKEAEVDDSSTDIASALDFASTLFSEGEIKRLILITDGFDTTFESGVVSAVERLSTAGIRLDTIYLDNNLRPGESEVQISDVEYAKSTYLDHECSLKMLIEANSQSGAVIDLYVKGESDADYSKINTTVVKLDEGVNVETFPLPTDKSGVFDYKVVISSENDTSPYNNEYSFTQTVAGKRSVLFVTGKSADVTAIEKLWGGLATVDSYVITAANGDVPCTVEELSEYDEIVLSNVDIRKIKHVDSFINAVDIVVSEYGKSLLTLGNLEMQNKDDRVFERFEEILPVSFGNANKDSKLYTIILDISRSMNDTSQLIIAKDAATKLVSILEDDDYVAYITLAGESRVELTPTRVGDCRKELYEKIQTAEPTQGTFIGEALRMAHSHMKDLPFEEKQVMLISDGLTYTFEPEDAVDRASKMKEDGITVSAVNVLSGTVPAAVRLLGGIADATGGKYYLLNKAEQVSELVFATIADELTETVIEAKTSVNVKSLRDDSMKGIRALDDIYGFINSKAKLDATTVLSVDYQKNSDTVVEVPLYAYRDHGNGRIASFTSSISGNWVNWSAEIKNTFFGNVLSSNTPRERINYPFTVNLEYLGSSSSIEVIPAEMNPRATATLKVTAPNGAVYEETLTFDLNRYFTYFDTEYVGRYEIEITYSYGNHSFSATSYFTVPYFNEYDAFVAFDVGTIHAFMRGVGEISTDGTLNLENDRGAVATYELSFRLPLLLAAVSLFVFDVFIRKFKWKRKKDKIVAKKGENV